ncbi:hypothetical protein AAG570_014043, partial [Ranatra chinensis]
VVSKTFYITTPIYYVNDVPHIGHAYTTIAADVAARYKRMCGYDTYFLTGTDEHGQKIEQAAVKQGLTPKELADKVVQRYYALWDKLQITHNDFIRTTDPKHQQTVQNIFEKLLDKGDIYEGEYEGWYCTPCESFRPTTRMKEPTYFFRMSKYQDRLLKHIEENPDFIRPESRRNEVMAFVKEGLKDLSVSRVTFNWGIPVKSNPKHVIYVWIDALVNYISALGYGHDDDTLFKKFWPADYHLMGKDIIRFHAVYWPTLLMALDIPLFKCDFAHGWWTVESQKMSKSLGNAIDPMALVDRFGSDQIRYFLLREVTFGLDGDFSYKALVHRLNGDLSNDLGNLVTRTLGMVTRYFGGVIPDKSETTKDEALIHDIMKTTAAEYNSHMDRLSFNKALLAVWELVGALNKYIDEMQPWALAKDPHMKSRLAMVLYTVCDGLRALSHYIFPFMPVSAVKLREQLGINDGENSHLILSSEDDLAVVGALASGNILGEVAALFPRLDEKAILTELFAEQNEIRRKAKESSGSSVKRDDTPQEAPGLISIDNFNNISLIAGKIESAEKIEKSDKLLKLSVNDGTGIRTIVAGIALSYSPQELVGKTLAILANLKPAKLMGVQSNGMVLAAFDGERHHVLLLPDNVPAGTRIK